MGLPEVILSSASAEMRNNPQSRILILGHDVSALSTQANLLTLAGYSVDLFLDSQLAFRKVREKSYDLAVICFSLSDEEQLLLQTELRKHRETLAVLILAQRHRDPELFLTDVALAIRKSHQAIGLSAAKN